jgi:hypothetical protein
MTSNALVSFLVWSTVLNYAVLLLWFTVFRAAHEWLYRLHGHWFTLSPDTFDTIHYAGLAGYKILVLIFNVVPLLALLLVR